jgi:hypothetical protein
MANTLIHTVHTAHTDQIDPSKNEIEGYIKKINYDIGFYFWKYYVYSAFWNYISTPLNLLITIMTALTTGNSAAKGLLTDTLMTNIGIATLMFSIFNTFFRPAQQLNENTEKQRAWEKWGAEFEKIYMDKPDNLEQRKTWLTKYQELFSKINEEKKKNTNNFCIDILFMIAKRCCIKENINWMPEIEVITSESL